MASMITNPLRPGAPLPPETETIEDPKLNDIQAEIKRAGVELMYATMMHRKAWANMRAVDNDLKEDARRRGVPVYLDGEQKYKLASGNVTWWRGELNATAAAYMALIELEKRTPDTRNFADLASGEVVTVFGWNPRGSQPPTQDQCRLAADWMEKTSGKVREARQLEAVLALIEAYGRGAE